MQSLKNCGPSKYARKVSLLNRHLLLLKRNNIKVAVSGKQKVGVHFAESARFPPILS